MQDVVNEDDFLSNFLANDSLENTYFNPDVLNNIFLPDLSQTNINQYPSKDECQKYFPLESSTNNVILPLF